MEKHIQEGTLLWSPTEESKQKANLTKFLAWLKDEKKHSFRDYQSLWEWSVADTDAFWATLWEYFHIDSPVPYSAVTEGEEMPGIRWFPGARVNFAAHVFSMQQEKSPAIISKREGEKPVHISWDELREQTASIAAALREFGVKPGERVAAYVPNTPHAIIGMLASASIGAVWSACSPDFGADSVAERFTQIEPKVLITINGYSYNGKSHSRKAQVKRLLTELETVTHCISIDYDKSGEKITGDDAKSVNFVAWEELISQKKDDVLTIEQLPFSHPLWVLYSSGTTGLPKPIVHGHGGMLIEHLKYMEFHADVKPGDRFFWYSTTGWMMWNVVVAALLRGATAVVYDGSPGYPDMDVLWKFAEEVKLTTFGTSATFLVNCMKNGLKPSSKFQLSALRSVGSTGSPLPPEAFNWVYEHIGNHIHLNSTSGGTDICSSFVGGNPLLPVHAGEIQCRLLGASVEAFDENGKAIQGRVGEMVITRPMPCMPLFFWGDDEGSRYRESYFEMFPGVWRHGDWLKITDRNSCVIYGRSDATLNKMGVRIGTSEIYRAVEADPSTGIADSLVVSIEQADGSWYMPLFVVMKPDVSLTEETKKKVGATIREKIAPRFVPDEIIPVAEIPYTLSGKKMEKPVKRILEGHPAEKAASKDSMRNPESLKIFENFYARHFGEK
ncbi:MAG: acetoacetate--CoA ligase [Balneolales bacterium]|nr:acetoacetate--CoA ligase [Balneolales bacterium]